MTAKPRVLLVSIVPPRNDCGVRIVMHRMFVERSPFELHVASNADFADDLLVHTPLRLPRPLHRLRKSRFGPRLAAWITDYENFVWPLTAGGGLEAAVEYFKPDVILTLAESGLCHLARKTAQRSGLPLAGLFLDWFPVMKGHFGHEFTQRVLSRRYRELYSACDLAFCISDGMQEVLGPHLNSHVIYPMPGRHSVSENPWPSSTGKFRLVYVGSAQNFYGRMLCALIGKMEATNDLEIVVVGPNADWPAELLERAKAKRSLSWFQIARTGRRCDGQCRRTARGDELRKGARAFHAHEFHYEISRLRRIWKTGDSLGTGVLHAGSRDAETRWRPRREPG